MKYFWHDLLPGCCLIVFGVLGMIFCRQIFGGMTKLAHKIFGSEADAYFGGRSNPKAFFFVGLGAAIFGTIIILSPLLAAR